MSNFSVKPGSWRQTSSRFQTGINDYTLADRVTAKDLVVTDKSGGSGGSDASGTGEFDWVRIGNLNDLSAGGPSPSGQAEIQLSVSGETLNGAGTMYVWEGVPGNTLTPIGITEVLDPGNQIYYRFGVSVGAQLRETRLFACGQDDPSGQAYPMGVTFAVDSSGVGPSGSNYYLPDNVGIVGGGFALPNTSQTAQYPKGYLWAYDASFGNVVGDQFTSRSDVSLKESITTISDGLEIVNQLRPVRYSRKADGIKEVGFIAQEVCEHLPEVVAEGPPMGVKYPNITAVLVNAVQSLSAEVSALKKEVAELRTNASDPLR